MTAMRLIMSAVLLYFAWGGGSIEIEWPIPGSADAIVPTKQEKEWVEPLVSFAPKLLPADRIYLSALYDAMAGVVERDGRRDEPILDTTEKFAFFHKQTLNFAIDKKDVGKVPGLGEAIDEVFVNAAGVEVAPITGQKRIDLENACNAISWVFRINKE